MAKARHVSSFFDYARKRHEITLRRQADEPPPWTPDLILRRFRFCSVFRELDRTTAWFRKYVRDPMRDDPRVLLATVVFRMFNRVESGEAIFLQKEFGGMTAFDRFAEDGDALHLRRALVGCLGAGPYFTGAYIISSPPGVSKLNGMIRVLRDFYRADTARAGWDPATNWREMADYMLRRGGYVRLEDCWDWLRTMPYLGRFHAYEIVTDLRHTALLDQAPDIMTWASPGPGARRGLNRVFGRPVRDKSVSRAGMIAEMRALLGLSREPTYWPQWRRGPAKLHCEKKIYLHDGASAQKQWPEWEMRDVEHTLCEFDKYERARLGEGKPRGRFTKGG